jgi:membrane protease subunit HflK
VVREILGNAGNGGGGNSGGGGGSGMNAIPFKVIFSVLAVVCALAWGGASVFIVRPDEAAVVLTLGKYHQTKGPGMHFVAWPVQKSEVFPVTRENSIDIGFRTQERNIRNGTVQRVGILQESLMLTGDGNIIDVDFQVIWNIESPSDFLFNLAMPNETIKAVSESAMREVVGGSELKPMLNKDRQQVARSVHDLVQSVLDSYKSGVNIVRVNFDRADPPTAVIDSFRDVQAAAQERETLKNQAEAYAYQHLAEARGNAEQIMQESYSYKAQMVAEARGEADRFHSIYVEYSKAPDVTTRRLYIETMEHIFQNTDKMIIDSELGKGDGLVSYLPLNELRGRGRKGD